MIAAVFPGQGSQKPGMGQDLYDSQPAARHVFQAMQAATDIDIAGLCFNSDEETLRQTQNAQLALYAAGLAAFAAFADRTSLEHEINTFAGHSVGEYTALAAAGILEPEEGARLVQRRGDLMARSGKLRAGAMSAILGLDREALEQVCSAASTADSVAVIANDNCPGQLVISGDAAAVERAEGLAKEKGAKRALRLNVSGAFHSPLMVEAAKAMLDALDPDLFEESEGEQVYSNVTAWPVSSVETWSELLEAQLRSPVRWTETIQNMIAGGVDTFIEFGSGEVLSGLIKRISKDVRTLAVNDSASLESTIALLSTGVAP